MSAPARTSTEVAAVAITKAAHKPGFFMAECYYQTGKACAIPRWPLPKKVTPQQPREKQDRCKRHEPGPAGPDPARQRFGQPTGGEAGEAGGNGGGSNPTVPVHRRAVLRLVHAQNELVQRGVIGEERVIVPNSERVRRHEDDGPDNHERRSATAHEPKPRMLLTMCPARKFHHTMNARIAVRMPRVVASAPETDWRQNHQYVGRIPRPMVAKCSFSSNEPLAARSCSSSSTTRMLMRYSGYMVEPRTTI